MTRQRSVSDSIVIEVDPRVAYDAVSDVTQMGRWSPENLGATLEVSGPVTVGTSFVGRNRRGKATWVTRATVTAADPGERFAFRVDRIGVRTPRLTARNASWEYRFEPVEGRVLGSHAPRGRCDGGASKGTRVTETWTDDRPWPDVVARTFDAVVTGGQTFARFQEKNIRRTLARLRSELETG